MKQRSSWLWNGAVLVSRLLHDEEDVLALKVCTAEYASTLAGLLGSCGADHAGTDPVRAREPAPGWLGIEELGIAGRSSEALWEASAPRRRSAAAPLTSLSATSRSASACEEAALPGTSAKPSPPK